MWCLETLFTQAYMGLARLLGSVRHRFDPSKVKSSKLSPSVWGKLLCESLDPPCVALLAQNVVVQGVAPGGYFLAPDMRIDIL